MPDNENQEISEKINSNNYLSNSYKILTRNKIIHFLFILIESMLNIFQELETFIKVYKIENIKNKTLGLNYVSYFTTSFEKLKIYIRLSIIILFIIIIDFLYIIIKKYNFKTKSITKIIIVNLLEILCFRTIMLIYFNLFFSLENEYFLMSCIFVFFHIYITINNFLYNHLFYFVPEFIDYPYDEFSSTYDIILFITKIILAIAGTINNSNIANFFFLILFLYQIFFSLFFIYKLFNHSYLFMKNTFLNKTKISLFFFQTIIIIIALFFGKNEIMTTLFLIICIIILVIIISFIYFIYNPYYYIKIKKETPNENIFFYLYILSQKDDYDFLFENKMKLHYKKCGFCDLCEKFKIYLKRYERYYMDDEKEKLINGKSYQENINKSIDLFDIIYNNEKYFDLIKKLIFNYKNKGKDALNNNSYYYINLLFLEYSDYEKNNITLSLNERILLEFLNQENRSILDNYESQINQLLLCNKFISLSSKILNLMKNILTSDPNFKKIKKYVDLSFLLKKLKSKKFKKSLFSHKSENISNSRHLLLTCSIIYEEIFNTALNSSQLPIRDNIQPLEDIYHNNLNKNNKIISLALNLLNRDCRIIRAGKFLYPYINDNLFDLFPLIFKQYQINLFMSNILENFKLEQNKENKNDLIKNISLNKKNQRNITKMSIKNLNNINNKITNNKNKKEVIEIKVILCENISSKMYYKLLTLRLTLLFSSENNDFILFDGLYDIHNHTLITIQDFEEDSNAIEKLVAVSEPELEKNNEFFNIPFKKYIILQNNKGFNISKISTFNLSIKQYNIYILTHKEKKSINFKEKTSLIRETKSEDEEEQDSSKNNDNKKMNLIEDNSSGKSQKTGSSYNGGINIGIKNKKRDNIYEYGGFNTIKKINIILIVLVEILLSIESYYLFNLQIDAYNNNMSFLHYREFSRLYFQLFSSISEVACISSKDDCLIITNIFSNLYSQGRPPEEYFNFTALAMIQNTIWSKLLFERRNYLTDIHKSIGNKKYNELFGKNIKYLRINQNLIQGKSFLNVTEVNIQFSEAILMMCNSFQLLTNITSNPVLFLNKNENPFSLINENSNNTIINDIQKEFYEMILNYKYYYTEFNYINDNLYKILFSRSNFIEIFMYTFMTGDTSIYATMGTLLYIYIIFFEIILVKIINYVNMIINTKNDDFNFINTFSQKIENLEIILQIYKSDPLKSIKNLNSIYNNYQQYLISKNKNKSIDIKKKNLKIYLKRIKEMN